MIHHDQTDKGIVRNRWQQFGSSSLLLFEVNDDDVGETDASDSSPVPTEWFVCRVRSDACCLPGSCVCFRGFIRFARFAWTFLLSCKVVMVLFFIGLFWLRRFFDIGIVVVALLLEIFTETPTGVATNIVGACILVLLYPRLTPCSTDVIAGSSARTAPCGRSHAVTSVSGLW